MLVAQPMMPKVTRRPSDMTKNMREMKLPLDCISSAVKMSMMSPRRRACPGYTPALSHARSALEFQRRVETRPTANDARKNSEDEPLVKLRHVRCNVENRSNDACPRVQSIVLAIPHDSETLLGTRHPPSKRLRAGHVVLVHLAPIRSVVCALRSRGGFALRREVLCRDKLCVGSPSSNEVVMTALFNDVALLHNHNVIGISDRLELVSDNNSSPVLRCLVEGFLNDTLRMGVKCTCRLVEQQNSRLGDDASRDSHTLLLTTREKTATLADAGVIALWQVFYEFIGKGRLCGGLDACELLLGGVRLPGGADETMADVVVDGSVEEDGLLLNEADVGAEPAEVEVGDGRAVEFDLAGEGIIPALKKANDGALSRTACAL